MIVLFQLILCAGKQFWNLFFGKFNSIVLHNNNSICVYEGEPPSYNDGELRFEPPLYCQRYMAVQDIIKNPKWFGTIHKIVDFGCAEINFFKYTKNIYGVSEILEVDIQTRLLEENKYRVEPLTTEYLDRRGGPLKVFILAGNIADPDPKLIGTDMVIGIEIIEHLYPDTLDALPYNIFEFIRPRVVVLTTPNAEFNILFRSFNQFRNTDHKFEWTREQFQDWANNITTRFPNYTVHFDGVGALPYGILENLGCCTQVAIFEQVDGEIHPLMKDNSYTSFGICTYESFTKDCYIEPYTDEQFTRKCFYQVIAEVDFPYETLSSASIKEKTLSEVRYRLSMYSGENGHYFNSYKWRAEIPVTFLAQFVAEWCPVDELVNFLKEENYPLENCLVQATIELCVIHRNEPISDTDSSLTDNENDSNITEIDLFQTKQTTSTSSDSDWETIHESSALNVEVTPAENPNSGNDSMCHTNLNTCETSQSVEATRQNSNLVCKTNNGLLEWETADGNNLYNTPSDICKTENVNTVSKIQEEFETVVETINQKPSSAKISVDQNIIDKIEINDEITLYVPKSSMSLNKHHNQIDLDFRKPKVTMSDIPNIKINSLKTDITVSKPKRSKIPKKCTTTNKTLVSLCGGSGEIRHITYDICNPAKDYLVSSESDTESSFNEKEIISDSLENTETNLLDLDNLDMKSLDLENQKENKNLLNKKKINPVKLTTSLTDLKSKGSLNLKHVDCPSKIDYESHKSQEKSSPVKSFSAKCFTVKKKDFTGIVTANKTGKKSDLEHETESDSRVKNTPKTSLSTDSKENYDFDTQNTVDLKSLAKLSPKSSSLKSFNSKKVQKTDYSKHILENINLVNKTESKSLKTLPVKNLPVEQNNVNTKVKNNFESKEVSETNARAEKEISKKSLETSEINEIKENLDVESLKVHIENERDSRILDKSLNNSSQEHLENKSEPKSVNSLFFEKSTRKIDDPKIEIEDNSENNLRTHQNLSTESLEIRHDENESKVNTDLKIMKIDTENEIKLKISAKLSIQLLPEKNFPKIKLDETELAKYDVKNIDLENKIDPESFKIDKNDSRECNCSQGNKHSKLQNPETKHKMENVEYRKLSSHNFPLDQSKNSMDNIQKKSNDSFNCQNSEKNSPIRELQKKDIDCDNFENVFKLFDEFIEKGELLTKEDSTESEIFPIFDKFARTQNGYCEAPETPINKSENELIEFIEENLDRNSPQNEINLKINYHLFDTEQNSDQCETSSIEDDIKLEMPLENFDEIDNKVEEVPPIEIEENNEVPPLPIEPPIVGIVENGDLINNNRDGEGNNYEPPLAAAIIENANDNHEIVNLDEHNENHIILEEFEPQIVHEWLINELPPQDNAAENIPIKDVPSDEKDKIDSEKSFVMDARGIQPHSSRQSYKGSVRDTGHSSSSLAVNTSSIDIASTTSSSDPQPVHMNIVQLSLDDDNVGEGILIPEPFPDWLMRLLANNGDTQNDDYLSQGDNLTVNPNNDFDNTSMSDEDSSHGNLDDDVNELAAINSDEGLAIDLSSNAVDSSSQHSSANVQNIDSEDLYFDSINEDLTEESFCDCTMSDEYLLATDDLNDTGSSEINVMLPVVADVDTKDTADSSS